MLTRLNIRNFKRFDDVSIELGNPVVFIGPNNSGKTTALQALALWDLGLKRWLEKRREGEAPEKRPGVAINRRDFLAAPIREANLLWRDLHVRDVGKANGKPSTRNVRIDIQVEGVTGKTSWQCGLEFDYTNDESFYCRPLRLSEEKNPPRLPVPMEARDVRVVFLPPMSGLADREFAKQPGEIGYLIGQGRTAEVLRNLCLQVSREPGDRWQELSGTMERLFAYPWMRRSFLRSAGKSS
jgi:energy-coupling factor transporter ATP-binding protein EcfA2